MHAVFLLLHILDLIRVLPLSLEMKSPLSRLWFLLTFAIVGISSGRAQDLVHAYAYNGTLNDSVGTATLTDHGGSLATPGFYSFDNADANGQGLQFVGEAGLQSTYTIAMRFSFADYSAYKRIIDFKNLTSDNGAYAHDGIPVFSVGGDIAIGTGPVLQPDVMVDFTLTRSSDGMVTAYQGTNQIYQFDDSADHNAVADYVSGQSTFWFFQDDPMTNEHPKGLVDSILIYNGALSSAAISSGMITNALDAIPESSTYAVLVGLTGLGLAVWRRRR